MLDDGFADGLLHVTQNMLQGVMLVLLQARYSAMPLVLSQADMCGMFFSSKPETPTAATTPYEQMLLDYLAKASTLYKLRVAELNFDLFT